MYQLIAIDMDGTLLRPDQTIHPDSIRDIQRAADRGFYIALCTGRGIPELRQYLDQLPMIRHAVCCNGAVLYDIADDNVIASHSISGRWIDSLLKIAVKYQAMAQLMTERESVVSSNDMTNMWDFHMERYESMYRSVARQTENLAAEAHRLENIVKAVIYFRSLDDCLCAQEKLRHCPLTAVRQEETSLEITALHTNKASGLIHLANHLHIPLDQTVCIGDSRNDLDMLRVAGLSVAMGNAQDYIKNQCNIITENNQRNGVGKAIRRVMEMNKSL